MEKEIMDNEDLTVEDVRILIDALEMKLFNCLINSMPDELTAPMKRLREKLLNFKVLYKKTGDKK